MPDAIDMAVKATLAQRPGGGGTVPFVPPAEKPAIEQKQIRLCIGVPSGDMLHADFAMALSGLVALTTRHNVQVLLANPKTSYIHEGRNIAVQAAMDDKCDYLLFLDSDMAFPPFTALRLLSHQKDVVGATYTKRVSPWPILGSPYEGDKLPSSGMHRMAELPTGCMLIDMKIFRKLEKPYFRHEIKGDGMIGEDILFCHMVDRLGFEIWCDMDLSMHMRHHGVQAFTIPEIHMKPQAVQPFDMTGPLVPAA